MAVTKDLTVMNETIYRQEALERLASPEQLDQLMSLTSPREWIALVGAGLLLLLALLWGIFGTIETRVEGEGILWRPGGVQVVKARGTSVVTGVAVGIGEDVRPGQELLHLISAQSSAQPATPVISPVAGRVLDVAVVEGATVAEGTPLVSLESVDYNLKAVLYIAASDGYRVHPNMEVQLTPAAGRTTRSASLPGRVSSAAKFPATRGAMMRTLQNEDQVTAFLGAGPSLEIVVELPDPAGAGAAAWRSFGRSPRDLYSGTPCRGTITIGAQRPIQIIFPATGHLRGG